MPWCSLAGYSVQRIAHHLSPCAASWKRPLRICQTPRTQMRSYTSTWTSPPWNLGPSVAVTPLGGLPRSAWRAWTLWPQWRSTTPTATSSVPNTRPPEHSLSPWKALTCRCHPPQPRCLFSRPATPLPTALLLPPQLWSCWRIGKDPEKCPGSDGCTPKKKKKRKDETRLITAKMCHAFSPVQEQVPASCYRLLTA